MIPSNENAEVSCETCAFFGKPFLCVRKEKNPKAITCLSYEKEVAFEDEGLYPLLPDVGPRKINEDADVSKPSILWFLVPLFFSIIGGLVGYVAVRDEDEGMATELLALGVFMFFAYLLIVWYVISHLLSPFRI